MQSFIHKIWLISLASTIFTTQLFAAELSSRVDRNRIGINETITLTVTYDEQIDSSTLDLGSLDANFEVVSNRPQSSSSISIINGQTDTVAITTWEIILVPKRLGKLIIPSFSLANASTSAIVVEVTDSAAGATNDTPLSAVISADNDAIYVGQQVLLEIELSASADVRDLSGAQISLDNAEIELLDQQSFQRSDNGVARQVIVLSYALFANDAGTLTVPALTFNGVQGGARSFFDRRGRGTRVVARTKPLTITVSPVEEKPGNAWFPASNVIISSQWSTDKAEAKVGEPLTRTIRIIATGQRASAIPPLGANDSATSYTSYADQPQIESRRTDKGFVGIRTESEAIVPSQSGAITLPEKRLNWFNVNSGRWEEAVLPAETIEVTANSEVASNFNSSSTKPDSAQIIPQPIPQTQSSPDFWKLATLFLALVTAIQFVMLFKLRRKKPNNPKENTSQVSDASNWRELQSALKSGDALSVRKALIGWISVAMSDQGITSLQALGNTDDAAELKPHLQQLDEYLYKGSKEINLTELGEALDTYKNKLAQQQKLAVSSKEELAPLYPH